MNEIPTEKLLPQGLQDMLSAQRECMAQANDIHNEIIDREMKTLHLPLKAKWYEMIDSGVKTEEYRILSSHWVQRLLELANGRRLKWIDAFPLSFHSIDIKNSMEMGVLKFRQFDAAKFAYGYTKRTMTFEIESITIGKGNPEWGAPTEEVFIIKLGKRV